MQVAPSRRIITCCKALPSEDLAVFTIADRSSGIEQIDRGAVILTRRWSPPQPHVPDHRLTSCEEWAINCWYLHSEVWDGGALRRLDCPTFFNLLSPSLSSAVPNLNMLPSFSIGSSASRGVAACDLLHTRLRACPNSMSL